MKTEINGDWNGYLKRFKMPSRQVLMQPRNKQYLEKSAVTLRFFCLRTPALNSIKLLYFLLMSKKSSNFAPELITHN